MQFQQNISLKPFNTFGIDVKANWFAQFSDVAQLKEILKSAIAKSQMLLPIGGGSNLLLTKNFEGLVLHNQIKGIEKIEENQNHILVRVGAGENWHQFVLFCIKNNWAGIENLSLIPGSVGAAPMQNIGAYGVELKDVFYEVECLDIATQKLLKFNLTECEFGYRTSIFKTKLKGQSIITHVTFKLNKKPEFKTAYGAIQQEIEAKGITELTIKAVSDAVISIRQSKLPDPSKIGNAGSFFKNPEVSLSIYENIKKSYPEVPSYPVGNNLVKIPAGWLIETAGWKGKTFENKYGVHAKQALVLVNYGGATGNQLYQLSEDILSDIKLKFGIELEREVNII